MPKEKGQGRDSVPGRGEVCSSTRGRKEGVAAGKKVLRLPGCAWGTVDHLGEGRKRSSTL